MAESKAADVFKKMNDYPLPKPGSASEVEQVWHALMPTLASSILLFTLFALLLAAALLWKKQCSALEILRIFGVILIIGLSSFLLVAGYSDEQLTPIVGLFGAIVGYLLGKDSGRGSA